MIEVLEDEDAMIRDKAASALGKIGPPAAAASGPLTATLSDSSETTRRHAAWSLGWIGVDTPEIVSALIEKLSNDSAPVRAEVAWALGRLGQPGAVPALIAALGDDSVDVRRKSAQALGSLNARPATPALTQALEDDDSSVRRAAEDALREINGVCAAGEGGAHTAPLADALIEAVQRVLASGWFALGPEVDAFENEFAAYCGAEHCVGVANGTDALELLLRAMRTGSGDEVITAANAGMYSTTALLATGATPVYADVDSCSLTLSPESVADRVTPRTRVVIATHLFGRMANLEALRSLADRHALALIEDCAQAHGASLKGRRAGTWAHGSAFSFYPTKNLGALGDAGAVVTSDGALAERVRRLRQYGWSTKYESSDRGGKNSRLDEMQAAVLRVKLPFLDQWNAQRKAVAACYNTTLQHPDVHTPSVVGDDYVAHLYVVQCSHRAALREYLNKRTIATGVHYPLLDYQQPFLRPDYGHTNLPISEQALPRILSLPCYPELSLDAVRRTCEIINHWKI